MQTLNEPVERVTVTLTKGQASTLRRLARMNGLSLSGVVRHAVISFLRAPAFFVPAVQSDSMHQPERDSADEREAVSA